MDRRPTAKEPTLGLRWLIHLTTLTMVGALLGAAISPQSGWSMTIGAMVGGMSLGTIAILRRWLATRLP